MANTPRLRAHNIAVSLDGYMAGPDQGLDHPLGQGGEQLHTWAFATRAFRRLHGLPPDGDDDRSESGSEEGLDDRFITAGETGVGATIMGRNMFGPLRGPWPDHGWTGWWGEDPPFRHPVFVLTHYPRPPITMKGGTTFHFVTSGIEAARELALEAAGGLDVRVGGGAATLQAYLRTGLLDELHLAIVPVLLGAGERLFDHLDGGPEGMHCVEFVCSPAVAHARLVRTETT